MGQFIVRIKGNAIEHDQRLLTSEGLVLLFFFKFRPHPELLIHLNRISRVGFFLINLLDNCKVHYSISQHG